MERRGDGIACGQRTCHRLPRGALEAHHLGHGVAVHLQGRQTGATAPFHGQILNPKMLSQRKAASITLHLGVTRRQQTASREQLTVRARACSNVWQRGLLSALGSAGPSGPGLPGSPCGRPLHRGRACTRRACRSRGPPACSAGGSACSPGCPPSHCGSAAARARGPLAHAAVAAAAASPAVLAAPTTVVVAVAAAAGQLPRPQIPRRSTRLGALLAG